MIGVIIGVNILNKKTINKTMDKAKAENPMPKLAELLGIQYEDISKKDKNTIMDMGDYLHGEYRGIQIEMIYTMNSSHADTLVKRGLSYSVQKITKLKINNKDNKSFQIESKNNKVASKATGINKFDEQISLIGDNILPREFLQYCAELGWMNLKLKGNTLTFNDDYMQQFTGYKILKAVHPIFKTSTKNPYADIHTLKAFIDKLIDLIEELEMK